MEIYEDKNYSIDERVHDLLSKMTISEKIGQLNQRLYGFNIYNRKNDEFELTDEFKNEVERYSGLGVLYGLYRADPWSQKDENNGITIKLSKKAYNFVQRYVIEHSRLHIPMLLSSECPHGHQAIEGYLLPVNLAVGAAFNPELLYRSALAVGKQVKSQGVNLALMSVLDVMRDPRWGRSEECFSEDPLLSSKLAKAAISGMQKAGVAAVAKHFCAQGEGTGGINASAARIGERELREIHLPAAYECCKAGVKGIMASYNEIDGIYCHANKRLLRDILREEFEFDGVVMADGLAVDALNSITGDSMKSGAMALKAGVDISLWDKGFSLLEEAVKAGEIEEKLVNEAVSRVLKLKFEQGLFDNPYLTEDAIPLDLCDGGESYQLAKESVIVLKNDSILPIDNDSKKTIALIGPNADNMYNQLGDYTPPTLYGYTVKDGMQTTAGKKVKIEYKIGCGLHAYNDAEIKEAVELVKKSDIAVLVLGTSSSRFEQASFNDNGAANIDTGVSMDCGEGVDSGNIELPKAQQILAEKIFKTGKPVITVLIQGRPLACKEISDKSKAVICSFYPGPYGGKAIAEIIMGIVEPSGRLPVSIPVCSGQLPVYYNYKNSYRAMKYYDIDEKPLYAFGEGLSYTGFSYSDFKTEIRQAEEDYIFDLTFNIKNIGVRGGTAVPQLYIKHIESSVTGRMMELKSFTKICINSGEIKKVSLKLSSQDFAIWNLNMNYEDEHKKTKIILRDMGTTYFECELGWNNQTAVIK